MLPLLKFAADGREHRIADAMDALAHQLDISDQEQELMLPSGTQTRYYNRMTWAVTYLTKSLRLEKAGRGKFKIAQRGLDVLAKNPPRIDNAFLEQLAEFMIDYGVGVADHKSYVVKKLDSDYFGDV